MSRLPFWPGKPDPDDIPKPGSREIEGLDDTLRLRIAGRRWASEHPDRAADIPPAAEFEPSHTGERTCRCAHCRPTAGHLDTPVSNG